MLVYLLRRLLQAVLVALIMSLLVFVGVHALGDPVASFIGSDATAADIAQARQAMGLDRPLWFQYSQFLAGAFTGHLGQSYVYHESAMTLIMERLPATLELAFAALVLAVLVGIPLGLWIGARNERLLPRAVMGLSALGISMPTFWVGVLLILFFGVRLGWLPTSGRGPVTPVLGIPVSFLSVSGLAHLALPALNLALFKLSLVIRLTSAAVRDALPRDYVRFARAKGVAPRVIIGRHVLRNIALPLVTIIGLEFGSLIAFSVVTESIFAWPGMGKLIIDSITVQDRPVIVAYAVMTVLIFSGLNLIVDLLYGALDPRVRLSAA